MARAYGVSNSRSCVIIPGVGLSGQSRHWIGVRGTRGAGRQMTILKKFGPKREEERGKGLTRCLHFLWGMF